LISKMTRWSQYDEDEERLPEGMRRVGYDADTQTYTYQDTDGSYWEGPSGARYGQLRRVGDGEPPSANDEDDSHLLGTGKKGAGQDEAWRMMAPFLLLICAFLLAVYLLLGGRLWWFGGNKLMTCPDHQQVYQVQNGDTCWDISRKAGMSLEQLESMNMDLNCDSLQIGREICIQQT